MKSKKKLKNIETMIKFIRASNKYSSIKINVSNSFINNLNNINNRWIKLTNQRILYQIY